MAGEMLNRFEQKKTENKLNFVRKQKRKSFISGFIDAQTFIHEILYGIF